MTAKATIRFAYSPACSSRIGRDLAPRSDLAKFIIGLRESIGETYPDAYVNGSLHVKLYRELPREDGQTILRNPRLITEKVTRRCGFLEGKKIDLSDLRSFGIEKNRFVLYLPNEVANEDIKILLAQFADNITGAQEEELKRQVMRATGQGGGKAE